MALRPLALVIALAFGALATGVGEAIVGACAAPCDGDNDEGRCSPTCASCACAPRVTAPIERALALAPSPAEPLVQQDVMVGSATAPADGHAPGIAHVPIAA